MTALIIIYLLGVVISYAIIRLIEGRSDDWDDVFSRVVISLFSWIAVLLFIIFVIRESVNMPKPPKFL